jgi:hypothetical protein
MHKHQQSRDDLNSTLLILNVVALCLKVEVDP